MKENSKKFETAAVFFLVFLLWFAAVAVDAYAAENKTVELGKKVYEQRCVICHGPKGDGKGLVGIVHRYQKRGAVQTIFPRDFTTGVFRFRTTATGCLPTNDDLLRVVTGGIPRAYMPSHEDVPLDERKAVAEYIKTFSKRWKEEEACKPFIVKAPRFVGTAESAEKGKKLYKEMKCWECHGEHGKGDGPKSDRIKDDWGDPILAFDFTTGALKLGFAPENVYTAYTTGLDGSGMPSYEDSMNEEERWHLVSYTLILMGRTKK
ncbi:MAG: cytochrome c [Nitrospirae bacterium]|nr:cytochrome c [Nitrospirota bacterium]MCL5977249.1 cytochrome c [Nitrospirota bacterium]